MRNGKYAAFHLGEKFRSDILAIGERMEDDAGKGLSHAKKTPVEASFLHGRENERLPWVSLESLDDFSAQHLAV